MGEVARRRPPLRCDKPEKVERVRKTECPVLGSDNSDTDPDYVGYFLGLIDEVDVTEINAFSDSLEDAVCYFERHVSTPNYLRTMIVEMFNKCLEDRDFALKAASLCSIIHHEKLGDDTVRSILLSAVQKELEDNDFILGNRARFLNAVWLLSELFFHVRFDDHPISILGAELIKYFRLLLTGSEDEMEVLAIGLIVNGSALKKEKPANFRKLMLEVRTALVARNISTECRSWLLLILDMANVDFQTLPEELSVLLMTFLGDAAFKKLKRLRPPFRKLQGNKHVKDLEEDLEASSEWKDADESVEQQQKIQPTHRRSQPNDEIPRERYRSPQRSLYSDRDLSYSSSNSESISRSQRPQQTDGHRSQPVLRSNHNPSHKSVRGRWSADPPNSGGYKNNRRIPVWEHDDRLEKDYERND